MVNCKCTHCGKQIAFGDVVFHDIDVSIKVTGIGYYADGADHLCEQCYGKLIDRIDRLLRPMR